MKHEQTHVAARRLNMRMPVVSMRRLESSLILVLALIQNKIFHAESRRFVSNVTNGRVKENELPFPNWLLTHIFPPCASTIPLAIDKPKPVPKRFVFSACQKRSKTF